jgi:hypothetical protein
MASAIPTILAVLTFGGILAVALAIGAKNRLPVRFRNWDEQHEVYGVARWAAKELPPLKNGNMRLLHSLTLNNDLLQFFYWMNSIPVDELTILAPFIDRMIDGNGPPLNLPAEYEDERPDILRRFKERMEAEELWPKSQLS